MIKELHGIPKQNLNINFIMLKIINQKTPNSLIKISKTSIERLDTSVINLTKYENLESHTNSVKFIFKKGKLVGQTRHFRI